MLANDLADGVLSPAGERFSAEVGGHLDEIGDALANNRYCPSPLQTVTIAKSNGETRELHIPSFKDRVVERALVNVLGSELDLEFVPGSFAYRPGLGVVDAVQRLTQLRDEGLRWVVRTDIDDCFDSLDRGRLLAELLKRFRDPELITLVEQLLERPARDNGRLRFSAKGTPQGGPLSPLLCNLYLHQFDMRMMRRGVPIVRYADDIALPVASATEGHEALQAAAAIASDLGLQLNEDKTEIVGFHEGFAFLGEDFNLTYPMADPMLGVREPDRKTLYVTTDGAYVRVDKGQIVVSKKRQDLAKIPSTLVESMVFYGSVTLSAGARSWALGNNVQVTFLSRRGQLSGWLRGPALANASTLRRQVHTTDDAAFSVSMARAFVAGKLVNMRTMLLRSHDRQHATELMDAADQIEDSRRLALEAPLVDIVRGHEGAASAAYFGALPSLFDDWTGFETRRRHPPLDPVNAALSFGYTLLTSEAVGAVAAAGLEPSLGYLHVDDASRPSLALDLVEEFRSPVVDSVVISMFHKQELTQRHFRNEEKSAAVLLTDEGRRRFIDNYERRMLTTFRHQPTGKIVTYRRALLLQARQIASAVRHGKADYTSVVWRR